MPAKITEFATEYDEIDRWDGGVGWMPHPEEFMQRASHALATDEGVWIVDPVDAEGVDELVAEYGEVVGVVVLSDYHKRDSDVFARRHGVSVHLPAEVDSVAEELDAPTERLKIGEEIGGYELLRISGAKSSLLQEYVL